MIKIKYLITLILFLFSLHSLLSFTNNDSPDLLQQYRFAIGLIQRKLFSEAERVLVNILNDNSPFSYRDSALFWLGECYYKNKKYNLAIATYNELLKKFPNSKLYNKAAYNLAWCYISDNNPKSAIDSFYLVTKSDLDLYKDSRLKIAFLKIKYNYSKEDVELIYDDILKLPNLTESDKFDAYFQLGIIKFNEGLYNEALKNFIEASKFKSQPKYEYSLYYLAESYFRIKEFDNAIQYFTQLITNKSTSSDLRDRALYSLAWCYLKKNNFELAIEKLEEIIKNSSTQILQEAVVTLVEVYINAKKYNEAISLITKYSPKLSEVKSAELQFIKALALSRLGEFEKAITSFKDFLNNFPNHIKIYEAKYQIALILISQNKYEDAIKELDPLVRKNIPPNIREKSIYRLGECHYNLGNYKKAKEYFERVIKEYPEGIAKLDALYQLAEIAYQQNDYNSALEAFKTISETDSELSSQAMFRCGEVLMKISNFIDAIKIFNDFIKKFPKDQLLEEAYYKLGLCHLELNDLSNAIAAFSNLINSKNYLRYEARYQIAEISKKVQNFPLAIQHYKAILSENPNHPLSPKIKLELAKALYNIKEFDATIKILKDIIKNKSESFNHPEAQLWLGKCLQEQQNLNDAILELLKVPILYPNSKFIAEAYANAAKAYQKLGNKQKAIEMWQNVLKSNPSPELIEEAKNFLK